MSLAGRQNDDGLASLAWLVVHRQGPSTAAEIREMVPVDPERLEGILARLVGEGRVAIRKDAKEPRYVVADCVIALGDATYGSGCSFTTCTCQSDSKGGGTWACVSTAC